MDEYLPPSESDITAARKKADARIKGLSDNEIKALRIKTKHDLFFCNYGILGYDLLSVNLHGQFCKWIEAHKYWQYTLKLLPRSHFKSTCDTIGESIQTALPDDTNTCKYPHNLGTNVRILIGHDIAEMAQKFLRSITQHFTVNPFLIGLFPECVPNPKRNKINIKELELPRSSVWNESTFDTMGVGARGQGNHYNIIKLDDIYGEAARDSKTEREAHIQWFDNIQSFLVTPLTDHLSVTGTRWAFDDVYAHMVNVYGSSLSKYVRSVYDRDEKGNLVPIFPEQFSLESLEILKKNKKVWNAQYINDPREGAAAFQPEWKRFYRREGRYLIIEEKANPFTTSARIEEISIDELDIVILCDPGMGTTSGMVVTGMDRQKRVFILQCYKAGLKPEEFRDLLFAWVTKWHPRIVAIEDVLFSALFEVWFRTEMSVRGIKFRIDGVKTNQKEKPIRVAALANWYSTGTIYFKETPLIAVTEEDKMHKLMEEEFDQFGASDDYHMHDALAQGPRVGNSGSVIWRAGGRINKPASSPNNERDMKRDVNTGYSKIRG